VIYVIQSFSSSHGSFHKNKGVTEHISHQVEAFSLHPVSLANRPATRLPYFLEDVNTSGENSWFVKTITRLRTYPLKKQNGLQGGIQNSASAGKKMKARSQSTSVTQQRFSECDLNCILMRPISCAPKLQLSIQISVKNLIKLDSYIWRRSDCYNHNLELTIQILETTCRTLTATHIYTAIMITSNP
jgi:hypothetical protein